MIGKRMIGPSWRMEKCFSKGHIVHNRISWRYSFQRKSKCRAARSGHSWLVCCTFVV
jgi:hypothetical protein